MHSDVEHAADLIRTRPKLAREIARQFRRNERAYFGLTAAQRRTLDFIADYTAEKAVSPSYDEIMFATGLASKAGVHRLVTALEKRGYIFRLPNQARSIRVREG